MESYSFEDGLSVTSVAFCIWQGSVVVWAVHGESSIGDGTIRNEPLCSVSASAGQMRNGWPTNSASFAISLYERFSFRLLLICLDHAYLTSTRACFVGSGLNVPATSACETRTLASGPYLAYARPSITEPRDSSFTEAIPMPMPRTSPLLSLAQIHSIYAPEFKPQDSTRQEDQVVYTRTSFGGREPGHPGHPPLLPESKFKKSRR